MCKFLIFAKNLILYIVMKIFHSAEHTYKVFTYLRGMKKIILETTGKNIDDFNLDDFNDFFAQYFCSLPEADKIAVADKINADKVLVKDVSIKYEPGDNKVKLQSNLFDVSYDLNEKEIGLNFPINFN